MWGNRQPIHLFSPI